ncbi:MULTISPECIES: potassium transporter TrkG [unclassified Microbulbifer]|uniref:potassium transporter TrkG n=1 Tax=unclassified Microbulbifer TaxID=2619833 RepID=UPI0027E4A59F|nr:MULTISPECIES: potassium transporter TrkG [unclassified Microbulbifer]
MQKYQRITTIFHLCSFLVFLYSLTMLVPAFVGWLYDETDISAFLITFAVTLVFGGVGYLSTQHRTTSLRTRDGFLVVVLFWVIFSVASATPFILDSRLDLTLTDAFFEGISGITTTGASVLQDIDRLPLSILYYRAQLNFLGGLGIIVLAIAVMPLLGIGGAKLYQSEMPGPLKETKLTPRIADTAKHLWFIYLSLAGLCALSYRIAGMGWFDAVCHSLSTVSLGGFSSHGDSLGFYTNSMAIELVGGVFTLLAAINFALYFLAITKVSLKPILRDSEFRFFFTIAFLLVSFTCIELYRAGTFDAQGALVHGFFQALSIMTDNGLTAAGYPNWPEHVAILLIGSSFFGGCVGSTCGGIKAMRFLVLYRQGKEEIKQLVHPNALSLPKVSKTVVSERVIRSVWGLFFLYVFLACFFIWGVVASGHDLKTAFGTVAACLNNMGVGYGDTATGFGGLTDQAKWLMYAAMLFGRLEIFPLLIVFSRIFWRY